MGSFRLVQLVEMCARTARIVSPELSWKDAPAGTKSFEDPSPLDERKRFAALSVNGVTDVTAVVIGFAEWRLPGGGQLINTGSWLHEPAFLGSSPRESPYWPGTCVLVEDDEPPRVERLLDELPG